MKNVGLTCIGSFQIQLIQYKLQSRQPEKYIVCEVCMRASNREKERVVAGTDSRENVGGHLPSSHTSHCTIPTDGEDTAAI